MRHYIIDGNNLIGRISALRKLNKKNKLAGREMLVFMIERFFARRNAKISLHFDGFCNNTLKLSRGKIHYSGSSTADEMIKREIEQSKNPKNLIIVTDDLNLREYARACSCSLMTTKELQLQRDSSLSPEEEELKIQEYQSINEFKKLFGVE